MSSKVSAAEALALLLTGFFFGVLLLSSIVFFCGAESLLPLVLPVAALTGPVLYFFQNKKALRPLLGLWTRAADFVWSRSFVLGKHL